jgi:hypothetical protein
MRGRAGRARGGAGGRVGSAHEKTRLPTAHRRGRKHVVTPILNSGGGAMRARANVEKSQVFALGLSDASPERGSWVFLSYRCLWRRPSNPPSGFPARANPSAGPHFMPPARGPRSGARGLRIRTSCARPSTSDFARQEKERDRSGISAARSIVATHFERPRNGPRGSGAFPSSFARLTPRPARSWMETFCLRRKRAIAARRPAASHDCSSSIRAFRRATALLRGVRRVRYPRAGTTPVLSCGRTGAARLGNT